MFVRRRFATGTSVVSLNVSKGISGGMWDVYKDKVFLV